VLGLTRSHFGAEDLELESRFIPELPGIMRWALDGLDRLLARGAFIQPASGRELVEQMSELGSPVKSFLNERCETGKRCEVERAELFKAWCGWCADNENKSGTAAQFGRDLRAALPDLQDGYRGRRERVYKGVRLLAVKPKPKVRLSRAKR
jgi:putative DNA primase/helicase